MGAQDRATRGIIKIDEKSMRQIMGYLRIDDHGTFVGYIRKLEIEHEISLYLPHGPIRGFQ